MKIQIYAAALEYAAGAFMAALDAQQGADFSALVEQYLKPFTPSPISRVKYVGWWIYKRRVEYTETFQEVTRTPYEAESLALQFSSRTAAGCPDYDRAKRLRAIARHHKPSMLLMIEGEELDTIAAFLAPCEAYSDDGEGSGRI